jgi:hypothetical protein
MTQRPLAQQCNQILRHICNHTPYWYKCSTLFTNIIYYY